MGTINKQVSRYEITAVYTHPEAKVDVVLVHGLNGAPFQTWAAKSNNVFWPTDLLPQLFGDKQANVLVYGYNADVYSSRHDRSASDNFIHQHAQTLVTTLVHYRRNEGTVRNPIIWVAHSLGGILTKRAILYSNDLQADFSEEYRSIYVSTYGIIFLGTPHEGSDMAGWGRILQSMSDVMVPRKLFDTEPVLLRTLKKDSEVLQSINSHFLDVYQRFRIHMAHENQKTDVKGTKLIVVEYNSANPQLPGVGYYGIEATHSGMCKFDSVHAPGWLLVSSAIREWVKESPPVIQVRWQVEGEERLVRARNQGSERMDRLFKGIAQREDAPAEVIGASLTLVGQSGRVVVEPVFIHPESFRPNSFFVGRVEELKTLHGLLMDPKRRAEGTAAVVVQCLPGGGKTQFARQYVFQHKSDYPGGVYWVRAKSLQEMEYWYWRIAKNEALRGSGSGGRADEHVVSKEMVGMVREWLNRREHWLMVLDGVHFDMAGLHEFIPDAKNSSLIFTSTERAVTGDPKFDNPSVMELEALTADDARDLLLLEMDKKRPWTLEDRARADELVKLMGRLPLMIHVAAQHLKATHQPLSHYLESYRKWPKVGILPTYKAVLEQLQCRGATAALNLMSMLAFLDQHIPVEMLTLGLSALDKATPVMTSDAFRHKKSLDKTIAVLMAFGLLERTEGDDMASTSSRSSAHSFSAARENADQLDLLRIHSVVQGFFVESLTKEKQAPFWFERAASLWCTSFDEAVRRMAEDPRIGLPDDYRRYHIHARKLTGHLDHLVSRRNTDSRRDTDSLAKLAKLVGPLEQRMHTAQAEFNRLSQSALQQQHDGKTHVLLQLSVFERSINSSQESDSTTPSSHESVAGEETSVHASQSDQILPPTPAAAAVHIDWSDPHHWHVPYPSTPFLMPQEPMVMCLEDSASPTPVPASSWRPPISTSSRMPLQGRAVNMPDPSYFTIKTPTAAPVSFSRERARGALSGPETEPESPSEAQRQLSRINRTLSSRRDYFDNMDVDEPPRQQQQQQQQQLQEVVLQVADPNALLPRSPFVVASLAPLSVPVAPGTCSQVFLQISPQQDVHLGPMQPPAGASSNPYSPAPSDLTLLQPSQAEPLSEMSTVAQPAQPQPTPSPLPSEANAEYATSFPPSGRSGIWKLGRPSLWSRRFGLGRSGSGESRDTKG